MANVIDEAAQAIRTRLAQLEALLAEQQQLKKALAALEGLLGPEHGDAAAPKKARPGRQAKRTSASSARRPATRRGGSRADQFVQLVSERPGITVGEAADQLKTSRNTLYNVTARLQREGRLRKDGRRFYPPVQAPASASRGGKEPPFESAR